jgi:hypothetical protein
MLTRLEVVAVSSSTRAALIAVSSSTISVTVVFDESTIVRPTPLQLYPLNVRGILPVWRNVFAVEALPSAPLVPMQCVSCPSAPSTPPLSRYPHAVASTVHYHTHNLIYLSIYLPNLTSLFVLSVMELLLIVISYLSVSDERNVLFL